MEYIFHLGRNPELSSLEIVSFLKRTNRKYEILKITKRALLANVDKLDSTDAISCLGGTIKISSEPQDIDSLIQNKIVNTRSKKINFGINFMESSKAELKKVSEKVKQISRVESVKALQKHSTEREIPPSKSKNLDLELTLFKNKLYMVSAVSDPKSYAFRDEGRPCYDSLKVVSVRLAKILINLAQPKERDILLDPFSGLGTILQEASLMNLQTIGTDNDKLIIKDSKANLNWAKRELKIKKNPQIKCMNVSKISCLRNVDCIATEPYLGPFLRKLPTEQEAREIVKDLSKLYDSFLRESSKLLKKGSKIAIVVPTFKTKNAKLIRIGFQTMLKKHGFDIYQPLKNTLVPIDYVLKGSKIRRKIYILEKLK